ncbi:MAG: glycosyltransferase family 4 protein [Actinomycetota bacterium]|nr:glycosyltransferase family 4 protein [Actinomycetota bacterium]
MIATFVLPKDPSHESTGDLTMAKLVMDLARESFQTKVICLSGNPASTADGHLRVPKPNPRIPRILIDSVRSGRSLVHSRFLLDALVEAVDASDSDVFVADHSYMAEAVLASRRFQVLDDGRSNLAVSTVVPEALVWRATRGLVGRMDARRITRDEVRVARRAYTVGTYDLDEAEFFRNRGIRRTHWLDLTLPPKERIPVASSERNLVFVGDRRWAPNQEAFETLVRWWPRIAEGITDARLFVVGAADPAAKPAHLPPGMQDLGFVDDLDALLSQCRALVAPIKTGGGVRVKILDTVCRGLPVVGTTAAVGSLGDVFGIEKIDDEEQFADRCRHYLLDRASATADGEALYTKNASRWHEGIPQAAVHDWLKR